LEQQYPVISLIPTVLSLLAFQHADNLSENNASHGGGSSPISNTSKDRSHRPPWMAKAEIERECLTQRQQFLKTETSAFSSYFIFARPPFGVSTTILTASP